MSAFPSKKTIYELVYYARSIFKKRNNQFAFVLQRINTINPSNNELTLWQVIRIAIIVYRIPNKKE